jgi:DNA polymerase III subunit delta
MNAQYKEIVKNIKAKKLLPIYLLIGDEPFYINQLADEIEKYALPDDQKSFNQHVFFGKDLSLGGLVQHARGFPMMGDNQVIIVREAQDIAGFESKDNIKLLEAYFNNPLKSTILVLCYNEKIDKRKTWRTAAEKQGIVFESNTMYDNKYAEWVADYCHELKVKISHKAIQLMVESIGYDLTRLASEFDKIIINLKENEEISADTIEKYVGLSKEFNVFEFQKAIITRDPLKANQIAIYFAKNPKNNPMPVVVSTLYNYFSKLLILHSVADKSENNIKILLSANYFQVKDFTLGLRNFSFAKTFDAIHAIHQCELNSKGIDLGSDDDRAVLQSLVFKLIH